VTRFLVALVVVLLAAATPLAQSETIPTNSAFIIQATHNGVNTDRYELLINGTLAWTKTKADLYFETINFEYPAGLPAGTYTIVVAAVNVYGRGETPPFTLTVAGSVPLGQSPAKPGNVLIIR
jgi:archaellum component FlaF (FlaF/FlaG flagellin family)